MWKRRKIVYILTLQNEGSVRFAEIGNKALTILFEARVMIKERCGKNDISFKKVGGEGGRK